MTYDKGKTKIWKDWSPWKISIQWVWHKVQVATKFGCELPGSQCDEGNYWILSWGPWDENKWVMKTRSRPQLQPPKTPQNTCKIYSTEYRCFWGWILRGCSRPCRVLSHSWPHHSREVGPSCLCNCQWWPRSLDKMYITKNNILRDLSVLFHNPTLRYKGRKSLKCCPWPAEG